MSASSDNQSTIYPDTIWTEWGKGRVPVGVDASQTEFNSGEKTGGEKTHTLTIDEMPSHSHEIMGTGSGDLSKNGGAFDVTPKHHVITASKTGGGLEHNNLQPYITCYMFKRAS